MWMYASARQLVGLMNSDAGQRMAKTLQYKQDSVNVTGPSHQTYPTTIRKFIYFMHKYFDRAAIRVLGPLLVWILSDLCVGKCRSPDQFGFGISSFLFSIHFPMCIKSSFFWSNSIDTNLQWSKFGDQNYQTNDQNLRSQQVFTAALVLLAFFSYFRINNNSSIIRKHPVLLVLKFMHSCWFVKLPDK